MLKRELKINRNSLLLWTGILAFLFIVVFLVYPSIMASNESINEMLKSFPEEMLKAFNMDISGIDTAYGWIKTEGYTLLLVIGGLYSAILGSTLLIKEENDKTIEFLYSKPISRNKIINSRVFCGLINIFMMFLIIYLVNLVGLYFSDCLVIKEFTLMSFAPLFACYTIFFMTLMISTLCRKTKKSMSVGIAIVFVSYFIQIISNLSDKLEKFKYFTMMELSSIRDVLTKGYFNNHCIIICIVICVIFYLITKTIYTRKELV